MNLTLRRGTKAGVITPEQHDALIEMAPTVDRGDELTPEASMVLAVYNRAGGCPVSMGMAGTLDRRAEVSAPRLEMARRAHPSVDLEFFENLFGALDDYYIGQMRQRAEEAAERAKG